MRSNEAKVQITSVPRDKLNALNTDIRHKYPLTDSLRFLMVFLLRTLATQEVREVIYEI